MTDQPLLSQRAETRAKANASRAKRVQRREAFLDLIASGYSHRQVATAMKVSLATVRREIDKALAERPVHAPERHVSLQVAPLTKALSHASLRIEGGDVRAFGPYIKVLAALDRYYGLDGRLRLPGAGLTGNALAASSPPPPLALTHAAEPVLPPLLPEVARFGAQDVEFTGASIDISVSRGRDQNAPLALAEPGFRPLASEIAQSGAQNIQFAPIDISPSLRSDEDPALALGHAACALPPLASEVAQSEIPGEPIDIAGLAGRGEAPPLALVGAEPAFPLLKPEVP